MENLKSIGMYYEDANHNKWNIKWLHAKFKHMSLKDAAEKAASTLTNCTNCTNCTYCTDCNDCHDCSHCSGCDNCCYCDYCKQCTYCNDCVYCSRCTACLCCGGCIDCKGMRGYFIQQGVDSLGYVLTSKSPGKIVQHPIFSLDFEQSKTAEKIIEEFALTTCYGFAHAILQLAEKHSEKYASYRSRESYEQGYADGYEGAM